ncbi:hypothetical protein M8C21_029044 [Ambrosia artemisiifolia]|uniref:RRM domain-containing protein n=1 Tax=Ambrosia artemisiifolia TaxID=4212 RepID=A0AAD5CN99_AMBAR|nr:hypothetical protein M8C21_029044 [Ambrosia artemisiifolia]
MAATFNPILCSSTSPSPITPRQGNFKRTKHQPHSSSPLFLYPTPLISSIRLSITLSSHNNRLQILCCASPSEPHKTVTSFTSSTKLYVSGLSFRTSEESLRNAFQSFGQLIEVNLVMDKIANRPRGFAFLRYATKEESEKAIEALAVGSNLHSLHRFEVEPCVSQSSDGGGASPFCGRTGQMSPVV